MMMMVMSSLETRQGNTAPSPAVGHSVKCEMPPCPFHSISCPCPSMQSRSMGEISSYLQRADFATAAPGPTRSGHGQPPPRAMIRQPSKAQVRATVQRVACMRRHGMDVSVREELEFQGFVLEQPWELSEKQGDKSLRRAPDGVAIRAETLADHEVVTGLLRKASSPPDAYPVNQEQPVARPMGATISLLATAASGDGSARQVAVGHIAFVRAHAPGAIRETMEISSLSVDESYRRRGIGSALVLHGLDRCRAAGVGAVWHLGGHGSDRHSNSPRHDSLHLPSTFLARLGFHLLRRAWPHLQIGDVVTGHWQKSSSEMGLELVPGALAAAQGVVPPPHRPLRSHGRVRYTVRGDTGEVVALPCMPPGVY